MTVVFKVGGSVFHQPRLAEKLRFVLDQRQEATRIVIAGGGTAADLVRDWDQRFQLGNEVAHRLAIAAMDFNLQLLSRLLPDARVIDDRSAVPNAVNLLRAGPFLDAEESRQPQRSPALPHTWQVTSDSIAAWISQFWPADELVLVKSCPPPAAGQMDDAVDPYFRTASHGIARMSWIDMNDDRPTILAADANPQSDCADMHPRL